MFRGGGGSVTRSFALPPIGARAHVTPAGSRAEKKVHRPAERARALDRNRTFPPSTCTRACPSRRVYRKRRAGFIGLGFLFFFFCLVGGAVVGVDESMEVVWKWF